MWTNVVLVYRGEGRGESRGQTNHSDSEMTEGRAMSHASWPLSLYVVSAKPL